VIAITSWLAGGLSVELGPLRLSATDPGRVALQAAVSALLAAILSNRATRSTGVLLGCVAVLVTAPLDSTPRRVGDGNEYMAMAVNLSHGRPPALSRDDRIAVDRELAAFEGDFAVPPVDTTLVGVDGRQDSFHFWLYPLIVAPWLAAARAAGLHPNAAFTLVNAAGVALLAFYLVRRGSATAAGLLVAGPLLWWIDKAHTEALLFVTLAFAMLLVERSPALALLCAALAAAQNPGAIVVFGGVAAYALLDRRRSTRTALATMGCAVVVALPYGYYMWHLGKWSPLATTIGRHIPALRALLTPLVDLNLGLIPYAPVLVGCAAFALVARRDRLGALTGAVIAALLVVFAQSINVNHGGSPGISRYAIWVLAVLTPFVAFGANRLSSRRWLMAMLVVMSAGLSLFAFRPAAAERSGPGPSLLAEVVWTRWPELDNPVPEVFAERTTGLDGTPPVPAATSRCEKVLIVGDGQRAWWPFPCAPREAPPACIAAGSFCYAHSAAFVAAPAQAGFSFNVVEERAWAIGRQDRLTALFEVIGDDARIRRPGENVLRVVGGEGLPLLFIVEGTIGTAIWARTTALDPILRARVSRASTLEIRDAPSETRLSVVQLEPGTHDVRLPQNQSLLVVVADATPSTPPSSP
jgi:hypothetical protein